MKRLLLFGLLILAACSQTTPPPEETLCAAATFPNPCPSESEPACGWYNENIQCFAYPCAQNFNNACEACKSENVKSFTPGSCPKPS